MIRDSVMVQQCSKSSMGLYHFMILVGLQGFAYCIIIISNIMGSISPCDLNQPGFWILLKWIQPLQKAMARGIRGIRGYGSPVRAMDWIHFEPPCQYSFLMFSGNLKKFDPFIACFDQSKFGVKRFLAAEELRKPSPTPPRGHDDWFDVAGYDIYSHIPP